MAFPRRIVEVHDDGARDADPDVDRPALAAAAES
jgi:hypothetical protein